MRLDTALLRRMTQPIAFSEFQRRSITEASELAEWVVAEHANMLAAQAHTGTGTEAPESVLGRFVAFFSGIFGSSGVNNSAPDATAETSRVADGTYQSVHIKTGANTHEEMELFKPVDAQSVDILTTDVSSCPSLLQILQVLNERGFHLMDTGKDEYHTGRWTVVESRIADPPEDADVTFVYWIQVPFQHCSVLAVIWRTFLDECTKSRSLITNWTLGEINFRVLPEASLVGIIERAPKAAPAAGGMTSKRRRRHSRTHHSLGSRSASQRPRRSRRRKSRR